MNKHINFKLMFLGGAVFKKLNTTPLILASSVVHAQTLSCNCITGNISSRLDLDTKTAGGGHKI